MARETVYKRVAPQAGMELQRNRGNLLRYRGLGRMLLLGIGLSIILASCGGGSETDTAASKDLAADFSFTIYQGESKLGAETLNLSDLRGRPVVLNFWAGLCPPCRAEMPDLQRFYEEFEAQVTLIGIDVGQFTGLGSQREARNLLSELGITYPAGFTDDSSVISRHEVLGMPTTVFINSKGEVFRKWVGLLNRDMLAEVVTEMLNPESGPSS